MAQNRYSFFFDTENGRNKRVFHDPTLARRSKFRRLTLASVCIVITWSLLFFGGTVSISEIARELGFWRNAQQMSVMGLPLPHEPHEDGHDHVHQANYAMAANAAEGPTNACHDQSAPAFAALADQSGERFFGHVPTALEWAPLSLESSCGVLDVIVPDWLAIRASGDGPTVETASASVREPVEHFLQNVSQPPELMPTILLDTGYDAAGFLNQLLVDRTIATITDDLLTAAERVDATGLCIDFRQLDAAQLRALAPVFESISSGLRGAGKTACIVLSIEQQIWADKSLMDHFDNVVLKAFRQPWVGSPAAPLAETAWFETFAKAALSSIGPERLTLALGNFAVEWTSRKPQPETLPFAEAVRRIADAKANLAFSTNTGNSFASYRDENGNNRKLWMLDAASAHNQIETLKALGIRNVGIWSLGREDPGLWSVLANNGNDPVAMAAQLSDLSFPNYVAYRGEGAFLRVLATPKPGFRRVDLNPATGRISDVTYVQLPQPYLLERYGRTDPGKLVLTFDDGPHKEYTAAILDTLQQTGTPAAFFVLGTSVMEEPELLNRIIDEGHEVGSHTFSHPRMDQVSHSRLEIEHGMMNKLIAGYAQRETRLYREPFLRAGGPIKEDRVHSLLEVQASGGIIAGMEIVPKDWTGMSAEAIVDYVVDEVNKGAGNVILMHDGGKDRSATVAAVPGIIRELKAQGYEFTTLADLLNVDRAALMPEVSGNWLIFDRVSFKLLSATWFSIETIFWVVLAIGAARMLIILLLARLRQRPRAVDDSYRPKVTVVIPAYNEEKVIAKSVRSVLASDYEKLDVVIVDDGSMDETFNEVLQFRNNPRVHIYAQLNQGKWSALNTAVANTDAEVIVCIDADTEIDPHAIGHLVRQFSNPRVGAVAGKITVGNRRNLLTRLQALEYITSQNFDRRAYDLINGMLVVPGAIGAWRTDAIRAAGLYCNDTMTEDADLTIAVNRAGYRVTYEEKAIAYTEAPESVRQLLAQRLRWSLGMFQCAWKHKSALRERRAIGLFSIPDMLIFGYLLPLLAPIADLFVLILLYNTFAGGWTGAVGTSVSETPTYLIWAYLALPLLDLVVAAYALKTDERENMRLLWLFPFQRFFYRQLLYFSVYRSVLRAVSGSLAGWGRMKRSGRQYLQQAAQ